MEETIKFKHSMPAQIRFSDVDQFGHVNNSVYFHLYDLLTKEPTPIPDHYKNAICEFEGKTLEELAKK